MNLLRRKALLACLSLPAGCAIQSLPAVQSKAIAPPPGTTSVRPAAMGQSWTYRKFNSYNSNLLATEIEEVVSVKPGIVIRRRTDTGSPLSEERYSEWGQTLREATWDQVQNYTQPVPVWPRNLTVGEVVQVYTHYRLDNFSFPFWISIRTAIEGWESIVVNGHEFNALRVSRMLTQQHIDVTRVSTHRSDTLWLVPEVGHWVVREIDGYYITSSDHDTFRLEDRFRWELTAWS